LLVEFCKIDSVVDCKVVEEEIVGVVGKGVGVGVGTG